MKREHAISYFENPSFDNLEYIIEKANRMGVKGVVIAGITKEKVGVETHLFFEIKEPK